MKKLNLLFCASLLGWGAVAQNNNVQILVGPDVKVEYQLVSMSANGKWACGNVNDGDGRGFLWDIENNEIIQIAALGTTAPVLDVANDGTMVGLFTTNEATANGADLEVGGYYKDGKWHYLEGCEILNGMSDNGQYFAGATYKNGICHAATWDINGEMTIWEPEIVGNAWDVTNDGKMACGYGYHHLIANRTPTLWTPDSIMLEYDNIGPNAVAWSFSPNGKKVLGDCVIYDIETKERTKIDISGFTGFKLYRVTNDGVAVGLYNVTLDPTGIRAAIVIDGVVYDLQEYLTNKGVDLTGWTLLQCDGISEDGQTFAVNAYDVNEIPRPLIIRLNANLTNPAPTSFKATHFEGTAVCRLTWKAPLANVEGVKGYQLWRNGEKLAQVAAGEFAYYDRNLSNGTYEYAVSAIYADSESEMSQAATATVADFVYRAPRHLKAVASGVRDMRLSWNAPLVNRPALKYGSADDDIINFGGGDYSFEQAVRFDAADWSVYGNQVTDITFYPMSKQKSWTVNFYTAKDTTLFHSEKLDDSNLTFGVENTVKLQKPVTLPEGEDVYVAIFVDVTGYGGYQTLGAIFNKYKAGYTDLLRRQGEPAFMSLYENAMSDSRGAYEYCITFPIGICMPLSDSSVSDQVVSYKVYTNNEEVATVETLGYRHKKLANGDYRFGVSAVYSNGTESEQVYVDKTMVENTAAYKAVTKLVLDGSDGKNLKASWTAPIDDDETYISYSSENNAGGLAPTEAYGYSALYASKYDQDKLGDYAGYQITDVRVFITSDAEFRIIIQEDGKEVTMKDLERGTGYAKGLWNVVTLDNPITIKEGAEYTLILDCYDVNPGEAPIGMDKQLAFKNEGDLYSVDNGETWTAVSSMTTQDDYGNWMMGLILRSTDIYPLPVKGYNVVIDRKTVTETPITETSFSYETGAGTHQIRVDVVYEGMDEAVRGTQHFITIKADGIENAEVAVITLETTATQIVVLGGTVSSVKAYNVAGALVAQSEGNTLDVAHLENGIYVLTAVVDGKEIQRKIQIRK